MVMCVSTKPTITWLHHGRSNTPETIIHSMSRPISHALPVTLHQGELTAAGPPHGSAALVPGRIPGRIAPRPLPLLGVRVPGERVLDLGSGQCNAFTLPISIFTASTLSACPASAVRSRNASVLWSRSSFNLGSAELHAI